ncbi:hypothetical protein RhiJN_01627 [Ceratobasidium sp. AG-Ba]|nr:hypothetical protein RhiJN_01627 [Ceratobasidium sp. AG-Ba]QRW02556.1 hypothetical protein RhiLY_01555 [Ceratobasidium sp. AG-Ba]
MLATDPADQQAARAIESSLRDAVNRLQRPPIELEWFMAQPKRVRRSAKLLEAAQADAKVLLDHVRAEWDQARQIERSRKERLEKARAQPRDIECLRAPDPAAWNGLGRCKKRCRAFDGVGRAYNTRQRVVARPQALPSCPVDLQAVESPGFDVPQAPSTPPGLRQSVRNIPGLMERANGPADGRDYGWPSPAEPSPPSTPSSTRSEVTRPDYPYYVHSTELTVHGSEMDRDMVLNVVSRSEIKHLKYECILRE